VRALTTRAPRTGVAHRLYFPRHADETRPSEAATTPPNDVGKIELCHLLDSDTGHRKIAALMRADGYVVSTSTVQRGLRQRGLLLPRAIALISRPGSAPPPRLAAPVAASCCL
jgi:hypothetical protein